MQGYKWRHYWLIVVVYISMQGCGIRLLHPISTHNVVNTADTLFYSVGSKKYVVDSARALINNKVSAGMSVEGNTMYLPVIELFVGMNQIDLQVNCKNGQVFKKSFSYFVVSDVVPERKVLKVVNILPHDTSAFTQGLYFKDGLLYESTGLKGQSRLRSLNPLTGNCLTDVKIDTCFFGEGIVVDDDDTLWQLTWQDSLLVKYDLLFNEQDRISYPFEGWGLTSSNNCLLASDGSNRLYFFSPEPFKVLSTVDVINNVGPVHLLNELEMVGDYLWANVLDKDEIVVIDVISGKVVKVIDGGNFIDRSQHPEAGALNGIAWDKESGRVYITGKNWPCINVCLPFFEE
ncbi:hypothetical protein DMA11_12790 [Marinilabiliaceae bacterium JC017]|nr:hypothetical protein DMA11_12790 [Marinilabiliaceae bacterium JC017]